MRSRGKRRGPRRESRRARRARRDAAARGSRFKGLLLFALFGGLVVLAVLTRDERPLWYVIVGLMAVVAVVLFASPFGRRATADTAFAPVDRWLVRIARGDVATIVITLVAAAAAYGVGQGLLSAAYPQSEDVRAYVETTFEDGARTRSVPGGGAALVRHAPDPPTVTAARIDAARPADDQRYTPAGVVLRYDEDIVAVLPRDGAATSTILVEAAGTGHRHFARLIGDFWGPRYARRAPEPPSARAVPDARDSADLALALARAARAQQRPGGGRVCYGWDVEIRSGRREGRWTGSSRPGGTRYDDPAACQSSVALTGWIDPDAGRFSRRSDSGAYELAYETRLARAVPARALDRIDTPHDEIVDGETGDGSRAGKGVLELAGAMPLVAAEAGALPPVPFDERPVEDLAPLAGTGTEDASRRAEGSGVLGLATKLLPQAAVLAVLLTALALAGGLAFRGGRLALRHLRPSRA